VPHVVDNHGVGDACFGGHGVEACEELAGVFVFGEVERSNDQNLWMIFGLVT
jgi:hypothetical protein